MSRPNGDHGWDSHLLWPDSIPEPTSSLLDMLHESERVAHLDEAGKTDGDTSTSAGPKNDSLKREKPYENDGCDLEVPWKAQAGTKFDCQAAKLKSCGGPSASLKANREKQRRAQLNCRCVNLFACGTNSFDWRLALHADVGTGTCTVPSSRGRTPVAAPCPTFSQRFVLELVVYICVDQRFFFSSWRVSQGCLRCPLRTLLCIKTSCFRTSCSRSIQAIPRGLAWNIGVDIRTVVSGGHRRQHFNEAPATSFRYTELAALIDPGKPPKTDRNLILEDAVRVISHLRAENNQVHQLNKFLEEKVREHEHVRGQALYQQSIQMQGGLQPAGPHPNARGASTSSIAAMAPPGALPPHLTVPGLRKGSRRAP
jgi:hypothetical protein